MAKDKDEKLKANEVNIPEVYGNVANISYSPYEMEMTLGLISSNYEGIKPVVNVRMSPQSERSRQTRRFPNKQEVCIKASRSLPKS